MIRFEVGKKYKARSLCDHECIWVVEIVGRTEKMITFRCSGERGDIRKKVGTYEGEEICFFLGKYSMSPMIRAGREEV